MIASKEVERGSKTQKFLHTLGVLAIIFLIEGLLQCWRSVQLNQVQIEIDELKSRIVWLENLNGDGLIRPKRIKRQAEVKHNYYEDGVPIRQGSYTEGQVGDSEGLRIYDNWYQHRKSGEIPQNSITARKRKNRRNKHKTKVENDDSPIKPYHRTSAAWVERRSKSKHNLNAHFDSKAERNRYPSRRQSNSGRAIDMPQTNFFKMTPTEAPVESTLGPVSQLPMKRHFNDTAKPLAIKSNRDLVRSGGSHRPKKPLRNMVPEEVLSLADQFNGLKAIHYVGELGSKVQSPKVYQGEGNQENKDGVFRNWAPARWALRMNLEKEFPLDSEGRISVKKSGLYYIYAQVNYLDEHDVNAFQVFVNEDPYLLCTVMTHTRHSTTKANTCFTSGVAFLEAEDQILVRDLEPMRNSVIRPSHTFFGLVQLSSN